MAPRDIIIIPDPVLRKTAEPIERFDGELKKLSEDMFQTMYEAPGIGLAAPQINIPIRMFVIDTALRNEPDPDAPTLDGGDEPPQLRTTTPNPKVFINPEIVSSSEERNVYEEGCLSIPDYFAEIERPASIVMSYSDINGKRLEETFTGIDATVIQHEYDHLDGVLFIDYLSKLKRDRVIKKFAKLKKGAQPKL